MLAQVASAGSTQWPFESDPFCHSERKLGHFALISQNLLHAPKGQSHATVQYKLSDPAVFPISLSNMFSCSLGCYQNPQLHPARDCLRILMNIEMEAEIAGVCSFGLMFGMELNTNELLLFLVCKQYIVDDHSSPPPLNCASLTLK